MASFDDVLDGLRKAEREIEAQLAGIRGAISALAGSGQAKGRRRGRKAGTSPKRPSAPPRNGRKPLSASARKAISDAQKARWAKQRASSAKK